MVAHSRVLLRHAYGALRHARALPADNHYRLYHTPDRRGTGALEIGLAAVLIALVCFFLAQRIAFAAASLLPVKRHSVSTDLPTVQVFVAARNEEAALPDLLQCLERLDYPTEKHSFVLVSDGSVDSTPALMVAWCREQPRSNTVLLPESFGKSAALQSAWDVSAGADLTAIYDADVFPASGALRMLAEEFADPRVGAAAGAVVPSHAHMNFIS